MSVFGERTRYVHVRRVDVFARREVVSILPVVGEPLLARPRAVPPGEEHNVQLVDDVRVGDVEVVLQRGYADVAAKLCGLLAGSALRWSLPHACRLLYSCVWEAGWEE